MKLTLTNVSNFWAKVGGTTSGGCWEWSGSRDRKGYGRFNVNGKNRLAHRVSFLLAHPNFDDSKQIDHICNNRGCVNPAHLRECTGLDNAKNVSWNSTNTSGFKGICYRKRTRRWEAYINHNCDHIYLGSFPSPEEAHEAYRTASTQLHGNFSNPGRKP